MARPVVSDITERVYAALAPVAAADEDHDWPLLRFVEGFCRSLAPVDELVSDSDDGPGWSAILDADRCPVEWLPWLAQFAGVVLPPGLTEAQIRQYIKDAPAEARGSLNAMKAAVAPTLTGSGTVLWRERDTSAYHLTVSTYVSQTPNPTATNAVLQAAKPAGLVLVHQTIPGQDYQKVRDDYATYADLEAAYATYGNVRTDT